MTWSQSPANYPTSLPPDGELPPDLLTPVQEALVRIIYGPDALAIPLFERWQSTVDMADLDTGCYRLYPSLYRRIRGFAPDHPFLGRLKGMFRRWLYRNHLLFHWGVRVVTRLRAAEIDCIVLKGAGLVGALGFSPGFRPMADIDILVRPRDVRRAMAVADPLFARVLDDSAEADVHIHLRHGLAVRSDAELEIDLHWRLINTWTEGDDPDAPFWETAEPIDLQGVRTLTPAPTEQLFHTIVHGLAWNPMSGVRWIPDVLDLQAAHGARIDWNRLVALARRYGHRPVLHTALLYLVRRFAFRVPPAALAALAPPYDPVELTGFLTRIRPWGAAISVDEMRVLAPERLARIEERLPGRRRVAYLAGRSTDAAMLAWVRALGADHICELDPASPEMTEARGIVLGSRQWATRFEGGVGAIFRLDRWHEIAGAGRFPLFAHVVPGVDGKWNIRVFSTTLTDWPVGAIVFRLDAVMGFLQPSILTAENAVPDPFLPTLPGFVAAAVAAIPAEAAIA